jgi:hypothetical protein
MAYWRDYPPTHVLVAAYLMGESKTGSGKMTRSINRRTDHANLKFDELGQAVLLAGGSSREKLPLFYKI